MARLHRGRLPAVSLALVGHGLLAHARLLGRDPLSKLGIGDGEKPRRRSPAQGPV